ncbi:MAG TPA: lactonase family protein [Gemmataceae bacterium]|nr:lactonase family protein [Gemmataceae bacterium]
MTVPQTSFACLLVALASLVLAAAAPADPPAAGTTLWAYVGTYTGGPGAPSKGIYRFDLDPASGKLTPRGLAAEVTSPAFLAFHPSRRFLYAVNEVSTFEGKKTGGVTAFALDPKTGALTRLNDQPSGGAGPCHLVVDKAGKHVLVANYDGGNVSVFPIGDDGKLGAATAFQQHHGHSVNKERQEAPHAHGIALDAANRFAFVCDLGLDKVMSYRYDADKGTLTPNEPAFVAIAPGSGPRHITFAPDGRHAYVTNELSSTVTAFRYDPDHGTLTTIQTISTLPKGFKGTNTTAEIAVHPSGKFLYDSNRGQDSIAVFTVDAKSGELTAAGHQGKNIKTPRYFGIDPTGTDLVVANQDSNSLVVFRINPQTGELTPAAGPVEAPMPVCVIMMPAPR